MKISIRFNLNEEKGVSEETAAKLRTVAIKIHMILGDVRVDEFDAGKLTFCGDNGFKMTDEIYRRIEKTLVDAGLDNAVISYGDDLSDEGDENADEEEEAAAAVEEKDGETLDKFFEKLEEEDRKEDKIVSGTVSAMKKACDEKVGESAAADGKKEAFAEESGRLDSLFGKNVNKDEEEESVKEKVRRMLSEDDGSKKSLFGYERARNNGGDKNEGGKETFGAIQRRIADLKAYLSKKVKGQQNAIEAFVRAIFGVEVLIEKEHKGPLATFMFAGPPGCGKTFISECAAEFLKDRKYARFNMSEYAEFGASVNGYELTNKPGMITQFVSKNPRCMILFDEIEKASQANLRLFLQILDAGVIKDLGTGDDVHFNDAILIFTTNVARNLYEDVDGSNMSGITKSAIVSALASDENPMTGKPYFPKELVSRWAKGTVVMFNRLEPYSLKEVVLAELKNKVETAEKNTGIRINCDYDKIASLIMYSVGGSGDARTMVGAVTRFIESELFDAISQLTRRKMDVDKLKEITLGVDYGKSEARSLFEVSDKVPLLFATDKKYNAQLRKACAGAKNVKAYFCNCAEDAKNAFGNEISAVVLDVFMNEKNAKERPSDLEDMDSDGVTLFDMLTEKYPEVPVYILNDDDNGYDDVAFDTFLARGAKGVLHYRSGDVAGNTASLTYVKEATVTGNKFYKLTGSSNVLTYNCAQEIVGGGSELKIIARKLEIKRSVKAEDRESVVADVSRPDVRFADVIGSDDVKSAMAECVAYLKNPKQYTSSGKRAPKGILLYGPSGTGKTMLAKALAGETDVTFIEKNATQFYKKYVGDGPESVRQLFRTARRYAPSIIFIDEVDGFARQRTGSEFNHSAEELLTTFLSEMEGFKANENKPVVVVCATNFGIKAEEDGDKALDPAFVRRFDKRILVGLPDKDDREKLIRHYLLQKGVDPEGLADGISMLAKKTVGYSHSGIKDIIVSLAERADGNAITDAMLEEAQDLDEHGKSREYSKESVLRTARHEAGHTIVSWANGRTPAYMTIVSRGSYGGYMMHDDNDDELVDSKNDLLDRICCSLGGRAAELVYYGGEDGLTNGASSDLRKATELAAMMIGSWGMYGNRLAVADCFGEAVDKELYAEVNALMEKELARAVKLISDNREKADRLIEALLERNSLDAKEMEKILGVPPEK